MVHESNCKFTIVVGEASQLGGKSWFVRVVIDAARCQHSGKVLRAWAIIDFKVEEKGLRGHLSKWIVRDSFAHHS